MSYPFETSFYDQLYTGISSELKLEFPQQQDEDLITWYRRLLYEFISYLQAKYEPSTQDVKIKTDIKSNKKKDNPNNTKFDPVDTTLFETNIENALDVVSQDSDFAIYLFIEWLPLLLTTNDYACICLTLDHSNTPAEKIVFTSIEIQIELSKITILSVNGIALSLWKQTYFNKVISDSFVKAILKIINASSSVTYDQIVDNIIIQFDPSSTTNSLSIGKFLHQIKDITKPLFIKNITLKSNLIVENSGKLIVSKGNSEKSERKKFNGRKYIKTEEATEEDVLSGILQTLMISIFRTFYDFDKDLISDDLFNYLFHGKELSL